VTTRRDHTPARARRPALPAPRAARAMTLLEVVLAVLLLALVATSVLSVISSINIMETNNKQRLAAYEVANRVMLMYFDDAKKMPDKTEAITYGAYRFFYDLTILNAAMEVNDRQAAGSGSSLNALGRYRFINVTVSDAIDRGDGLYLPGEPVASLSRLMDPAAPRNPDSLENFGRNLDNIGDMINSIFGGNVPGGGNLPTGPRGPAPNPK
jgi:type II secretory pathway pseudopilin PulG